MWQGILGHDDVAQRFRRTLSRGRLASTYLFVGPPGIGKRRFALALAKALLCGESDDASLEPCGTCESCRLFDAGSHPDLDVVGLPTGKAALPIALFVGDAEHRHQDGLCHRLSLKPFLGRRKIAVIDDADLFNAESANCLLKTLEEPPAHSLLILIGTNLSQQLPTIRSRAQIVRFRPLREEDLAEVLIETQTISDPQEAERLAAYSGGSIERAQSLTNEELWQFREQLLGALASGRPDSLRLARSVQASVDDAGKDSAARRDRLRTIVAFAMDYYRAWLQTLVGRPATGDALLGPLVEQATAAPQAGDVETALAAVDRSLRTLEQVDRNANLGLVIQHWCDELADLQLARS